jgi:hypothetical protein
LRTTTSEQRNEGDGQGPHAGAISRVRGGCRVCTPILGVPVTSDLQQIPGIGPAYELKLKEGTGDDVVETCHQLIGKFLSFKGTGVTSKEHCDAVRRPCPDPPPAFFICDSAPAL